MPKNIHFSNYTDYMKMDKTSWTYNTYKKSTENPF